MSLYLKSGKTLKHAVYSCCCLCMSCLSYGLSFVSALDNFTSECEYLFHDCCCNNDCTSVYFVYNIWIECSVTIQNVNFNYVFLSLKRIGLEKGYDGPYCTSSKIAKCFFPAKSHLCIPPHHSCR